MLLDGGIFKMSDYCALCKVTLLATELANNVKCSDRLMELTFCKLQLIVHCSRD